MRIIYRDEIENRPEIEIILKFCARLFCLQKSRRENLRQLRLFFGQDSNMWENVLGTQFIMSKKNFLLKKNFSISYKRLKEQGLAFQTILKIAYVSLLNYKFCSY